MTLAFHVPAHRATSKPAPRIGDAVSDLGKRYAAYMNASDFAIALQQRQVPLRGYQAFIATMYPLVVGFNRALIRSIAKVDHVRNASFVRFLAEQLEEEQTHNELWRGMLETFGIDHERLYDDVETYYSSIPRDALDRCTHATLAAVRNDLGAATSMFPGAIFPDALLALCHYLNVSASDDAIPHWEHFASQAVIEMVIYDVVSHSILPGVLEHPELDRGTASTNWWREHGQLPGRATVSRTDEEKHLALSRMALNRSDAANAIGPAVRARAEDALRLFAAALIVQRPHRHGFPVERYLKARAD